MTKNKQHAAAPVKALLGRKAGDEVSVTTEEGGSYTVRIKSITKEEDNGDGPIL